MSLENTGERMVMEFYQSNLEDHLIYLFHIASYRYALRYVKNKRVLDFGCGSGYGAALIADDCAQVVGVDISSDAICYANEHFRKPNLSFQVIGKIEESGLPFRDHTFDTITSFQVIEHISDVSCYLQEISRLLKADGTIILATPDRSGRLFSFQKPWNRWHVHEFSDQELRKWLTQFFDQVEILKMGGKEEMMQIELKRTRMMKWLTLPFTLPISPESFRIWGLNLLRTIKAKKQPNKPSETMLDFYHEKDLSISESEVSSVNLIAIARQPKSPKAR